MDAIFTPELIQKMNEAALDVYRQGWAVGDASIVTSHSPDSFTFTWVPENKTVSKADFAAFFGEFITGAEAEGRPKYKMRFDNIIHRTVCKIETKIEVNKIPVQIGDTIYEAAEWIVDGYDKGVYMNSAQRGKLIWDMATTQP